VKEQTEKAVALLNKAILKATEQITQLQADAKDTRLWQSHLLPRVNGHTERLTALEARPHDKPHCHPKQEMKLRDHGESLKAAHGKLAGVTGRQESLADLVLLTRVELRDTRTLLRAAMQAWDDGMMLVLGKGDILTIEGVGKVVRLPSYTNSIPASDNSDSGPGTQRDGGA